MALKCAAAIDPERYEALYGRACDVVVRSARVGDGRIVWWAGSTPLTNEAIAEAHNFELLLNVLGSGERTILWDEHYHGYGRSLWSYAAGTPLPWAAAHLALLAVAALLTWSRRPGPVRPAVLDARTSPMEFVETMGGLYERAAWRRGGAAAARRLRAALASACGLSADAGRAACHDGGRPAWDISREALVALLHEADTSARPASTRRSRVAWCRRLPAASVGPRPPACSGGPAPAQTRQERGESMSNAVAALRGACAAGTREGHCRPAGHAGPAAAHGGVRRPRAYRGRAGDRQDAGGPLAGAHPLARFHRVQCTPDLMPADIVGANIFNMASSQFTLHKGPVFTDLLLVDEINRMPPRTQAALLEAMEERQVTIDGQSHALSPSFTTFATQNPIEFEGTYPLPEAELDRFLVKIRMGYPDVAAAEEETILQRYHEGFDARALDRVALEPLSADGSTPRATRSRPVPSSRCCSVTSRHRAAHARVAGALARRQPARRHRPAAAVQGLRRPRGSRLPPARRREARGAVVLRHRLVLKPEADLEG
jgi:MoxR-like ATPase